MPLASINEPVAKVVKQETETSHKAAEAALLPKLTGIRSMEDYAAILKMFYGYFHPLEQIIQEFIEPADLPDISGRRTASYVLADLTAAGFDTTAIRICQTLPEIQNKAQAFGALYVLEGSTLGGKMIAKMLAKNGVVAIPEAALNFFNSYGTATGSMWTAFIGCLNQQGDANQIAAGANATFLHLKNWMQELLYE